MHPRANMDMKPEINTRTSTFLLLLTNLFSILFLGESITQNAKARLDFLQSFIFFNQSQDE